MGNPTVTQREEFQSTPPARGATFAIRLLTLPRIVSIHTPREGGDFFPPVVCASYSLVSIHTPREGGDIDEIYQNKLSNVSIHTPREGGDWWSRNFRLLFMGFNPHPPRGGRRRRHSAHRRFQVVSIHTPREGGDLFFRALDFKHLVSIHTPREGGDTIGRGSSLYASRFQSTPPARGATIPTSRTRTGGVVSIHTPREGGDSRNNRKNSGNFCDVYNTISFLHKSA